MYLNSVCIVQPVCVCVCERDSCCVLCAFCTLHCHDIDMNYDPIIRIKLLQSENCIVEFSVRNSWVKAALIEYIVRACNILPLKIHNINRKPYMFMFIHSYRMVELITKLYLWITISIVRVYVVSYWIYTALATIFTLQATRSHQILIHFRWCWLLLLFSQNLSIQSRFSS